jgi:RNA polymerase sigma-54 factor
MKSGLNLHTKQKQTLQLSLKQWLPLLQAPLDELDSMFKERSYDNPFLKYRPASYGSSSPSGGNKSGFIENVSGDKPSLSAKIISQIEAPLFPAPKSQKVAREILCEINDDGYFEGEIEKIAIACGVTDDFALKIRERFAYIEPYGVGAVDVEESFLFQLLQLSLDEELHALTQKMIANLKQVDRYYKHHRFEEAKAVIKTFNHPPAIDYQKESPAIVPDFFVEVGDDIVLKLNSNYYPDVVISDAFKNRSEELKEKLKEARDMVNLLELRKSTLYKLVLVIVEKQTRFFIGSELKPLTMAQVAQELGFEESTISRAVANKYIQCSRGIFPLRSFFTNAVSKDLSSSEIKNYIASLICNESHEEPLTDQDLADMVLKKYDLKMVRRTITKYRKLLDIPSSKDRKKQYMIND